MIIIILLVIIILVAIFATIALNSNFRKKRSIQQKGEDGEDLVRKIIGKTQPGKQYVINDIIIPGSNEMTCQIDHILINKNGVYVIETKNYSGTIYGDDNQREWTQVFNYGKQKRQIYSPVKQNQTHIINLKKQLQENIPFFSIIVFVNGNIEKLKSQYVFTPQNLNSVINNDLPDTIDDNKQQELYNHLVALKSIYRTTNDTHVKNIQNMMTDIENNICPRCHGKLILRNGKNGQFYGCENYPECKFTKKLEKED